MNYEFIKVTSKVHRLIPSRYPPISLFDWAESSEELEEVAALEGLTNDRLVLEYGNINLVAKEDWVTGEGATPIMAAFTHPGYSRFSDGTFGIYYASDSLATAIAETKFHRERFLRASKEAACLIQMRQYSTNVLQPLVDISKKTKYRKYLNPDVSTYPTSQNFGRELRAKKQWGIYYPSVRKENSNCVAILRAPALDIPVQGCHFNYVWDGQAISDIRQLQTANLSVQ